MRIMKTYVQPKMKPHKLKMESLLQQNSGEGKSSSELFKTGNAVVFDDLTEE